MKKEQVIKCKVPYKLHEGNELSIIILWVIVFYCSLHANRALRFGEMFSINRKPIPCSIEG